MIKVIIKNYRYIQEQTQTKDIRLKVLIIIEEDTKAKQAAARVCARGGLRKVFAHKLRPHKHVAAEESIL